MNIPHRGGGQGEMTSGGMSLKVFRGRKPRRWGHRESHPSEEQQSTGKLIYVLREGWRLGKLLGRTAP